MKITIDLRDRCARGCCKKLIKKSKGAKAEFEKYKPFCSFHCQQWGGIEEAQKYININFKNGD